MRVAIGLLLIVSTLSAAQVPAVYPVGDARAGIAAAVAAAKRDGKHVILDFGADWCPDCRVLDAVLKDPLVQPFVAANFHVVRIDVGRRDRNGDLAEEYRATSGEWIPALVALDSSGAIVGATSTDVRFTRRTTPAELVAILQKWAPTRTVAELGSFVQSGVRVHVALERDSRDQAWIAAAFRPIARDVHLYGASLPADGIDGLGRPTRLTLVPSPVWQVMGPAVPDRLEEVLRFELLKTALPVYPAGPVTLRVPVTIAASNAAREAEVQVSYMACSDTGCLPPVADRRMRVKMPAVTR